MNESKVKFGALSIHPEYNYGTNKVEFSGSVSFSIGVVHSSLILTKEQAEGILEFVKPIVAERANEAANKLKGFAMGFTQPQIAAPQGEAPAEVIDAVVTDPGASDIPF